MIGLLTGTVRHGCVLTAAGVGYRVEAVTLLVEGETVELLIETHGRDGDVRLYGFATPDELQAFKALLKAPGVGPAAALSVLRTLGVPGVVAAIAAGSATQLATARGVGKRAAASIIAAVPLDALPAVATPAPAPAAAVTPTDELLEALVSLGVSAPRAREVLEAVLGSGLDPEDEATVLATALAQLADPTSLAAKEAS